MNYIYLDKIQVHENHIPTELMDDLLFIVRNILDMVCFLLLSYLEKCLLLTDSMSEI